MVFLLFCSGFSLRGGVSLCCPADPELALSWPQAGPKPSSCLHLSTTMLATRVSIQHNHVGQSKFLAAAWGMSCVLHWSTAGYIWRKSWWVTVTRASSCILGYNFDQTSKMSKLVVGMCLRLLCAVIAWSMWILGSRTRSRFLCYSSFTLYMFLFLTICHKLHLSFLHCYPECNLHSSWAFLVQGSPCFTRVF